MDAKIAGNELAPEDRVTNQHTNVMTSIRVATPGDRPAVERLLVASRLPLDGVVENLAGFVVAESDGKIVGVAGLELCGSDALLRSVAVDEAWRSRGVGHALVDRVIAGARERDLHALYLLTTTAREWFPAFGFREIRRDEVPDGVRATVEFKSACPASATVMMRAVSRDRSRT